jgi:hypothetical protein
MSLKPFREGIPTPFPAVGIPVDLKPRCICSGFVSLCLRVHTPDFGRFSARAAVISCGDAALASNLPHTSRSRSDTGFFNGVFRKWNCFALDQEQFFVIGASGQLYPVRTFYRAFAEAIGAAKQRYSDALVFALNGRSSGDETPFQPASEVFDALQWLAEIYRPARLGAPGAGCANFNHNIREIIPGWFYSAHQSEIVTGRFAEWYRCTWEGRTYQIFEHIGSGTSRRPEETIRIAFDWDEERQQVVIGYIGQHQKNTLS